uniref:Small ribosomal subunit protein uS4 n=1 Tax=uncultured marine group II/III euryarchaeote KM3_13_G01 TaxID=1457873 RepID=A0A075GH20_9EURY|nr:ribosomal protein S4 (RP-S4, rpsD) [uncultured marine group II/III euryarchaeote KM3_13_G01]
MGHPKFSRRAWQGPKHPWQSDRIEEERALITNYGLRNHREIWKARSKLRRWRNNAMKLIGRVDSSAGHYSREKDDLITSLQRRGLLPDGATIDDVLRLTVEHVLARRLQSQVYYKGLASSPNQARQLLIHGHVVIGDQVMTVPGYILTREEEEGLQYNPNSTISNPEHAMRQEIDQIRAGAEYETSDSEVALESDSDAPSVEEVAEIAAAVAAAPGGKEAGGEA